MDDALQVDYGDIQFQLLKKILDDKCIRTVYQPVVSLADGKSLGYEALSRLGEMDVYVDISQIFNIKKTCEFEMLCKERALTSANAIRKGKLLFLNVSLGVISNEKFRTGFTVEYLKKFGFAPENVVFEINERDAVADIGGFLNIVKHYKNLGFRVAIDNVGSGFSGLHAISSVKPDFIKIDMSLVRNVDKDEIKLLLCKAMADFGHNAGVKLIAEGIETEDELRTLITLKFDYGQGFIVGRPHEDFANAAPETAAIIKKHHKAQGGGGGGKGSFPVVGGLAKPGLVFDIDELSEKVYNIMLDDKSITSFAVVKDGVVSGFMTRNEFLEKLGGRYGYALHSKKSLNHIMDTDFMSVNYDMPIDHVSRFAMQREAGKLYAPIVVEKEGKYFGMVTVKDLLDAHTKIEIETAVSVNPLSKLPGNVIIEREIHTRILDTAPYCMIYIDLDNFKAYNDAYGFENGDLMLKLVVDIIRECATKNEFLGHIGGDDFIIICDYHDASEMCKSILEKFADRVKNLYRENDIEAGFITSVNRNGVVENFPIASLSVAGITNKTNPCKTLDEFSTRAAQLKKKCKRRVGNYFEIV